MKLLLIAFIIFFVVPAKAANYYFSSLEGNDTRTSLEAQNPTNAWQSIQKLNTFFSNLQPGDSVFFKRGEIFYGQIIISKSGSSSHPIVISAYGVGEKPIISGFISISNWTSVGGGIWQTINNSFKSSLNIVTLNGLIQGIGRYPNDGYLKVISHSGSTQITGNQTGIIPDYTGGELVIRKERWLLDRNLITVQTGNNFTFTPGSSYSPKDNFGYFIENNLATLDTFGEWCFNHLSKKLSFYFGNTPPSSYEVKSSSIDTLISIQNKSYIIIKGIKLTGSNIAAIEVSNSSYLSILNTDIDFSGTNGINCTTSNNLRFDNLSIKGTNNNAFQLNSCSNSSLTNSNLIKTGIIAGMGGSGDGQYEAIMISGNNNLVQYNNIDSTGYIPINFAGDSVTVKNNFISNFALTKDDAGGIYTFTGATNTTVYRGRKVVGNIILNGVGAGLGTDLQFQPSVNGIYMDDNVNGVEISHNTVSNCNGNGIFIHNAHELIFFDNTLYNNTTQMAVQKDDTWPSNKVENINVKKNIFFSKHVNQPIIYFYSQFNDVRKFGSLDSNYYCRPMEDNFKITTNGGISPYNETLDLQRWNYDYNYDYHTESSPFTISPFSVLKIIGNNMFANGNFDNNTNGADFYSYSGSLSIQHIPNGISEGSLKASFDTTANPSNKDRSGLIIIDIGAISSSKNYVLNFSAKGTNNNRILTTFLYKNAPPYTHLSNLEYFKVLKNTSNYQLLFSFPKDEPNASLVFQADEEDGGFVLDNVALFEASVKITNPNDYIKFEFNATNAPKIIPLQETYIDSKNLVYSKTVSLPSYSSILLLKTNSSCSNLEKPVIVHN